MSELRAADVKSGPHKSANGRWYCIMRDGRSRMLSEEQASKLRRSKGAPTARKPTGKAASKKATSKKTTSTRRKADDEDKPKKRRKKKYLLELLR